MTALTLCRSSQDISAKPIQHMQHTDISSSDSFHITTLRDDFKKLDIVAKYDCDMITLYKCQVNNIDIWL